MDDVKVPGDGELWSLAGSGDAADDLVSIVFLEAWRRRGEVELVRDSALPWLYGVASHTIAHRTRTTLRHRRAISRLPAAVLEPDHAEDVVRRIDDQRRLDAVHLAIARLSSADQDVLVLCAWQQLDYAAAAVALGVPVGTVRSRLSRARARLARAVEERPPEPIALDVTDPDPTGRARTRPNPLRPRATGEPKRTTTVPAALRQGR